MASSIRQRFWSKVTITNACWLWEASTDKDGYGQFYDGNTMVKAHRFSYEDVNGPIPSRLVSDHLCRVRRCVRPSHIEIVTRGENVLRGAGLSAINSQKTECPKGHAFTEDNTIHYRGTRKCRTCDRDRNRIKYQKNKG